MLLLSDMLVIIDRGFFCSGVSGNGGHLVFEYLTYRAFFSAKACLCIRAECQEKFLFLLARIPIWVRNVVY